MRASLIGFVVALQTGAAIADVELKNDGFVENGSIGVQLGFASGEMGASRFVAPDAGRTLTKVQFLFAGAAETRTVTLHVYDDTAGTNAPGGELYSGDFTVMGSDTAMQEIMPDMQVTLPQQFRVAIELQTGGAPSLARDDDGTITAGRNFLFAIPPNQWMQSPLTGDWIIRAFVSGTGGPGPGPDGGPISGADCTGNGDCAVGEFCDTAVGTCTFECREDSDCGDGACNSLGQCVAGGDGGGCCRTDRGGTDIGALVFGGLFGVLVLRRRRRCA